ncbi:RNA-guided pseudouridylation complex pseudouridine synthase subunit Cbf5 [Methanogenium sp. MK-MG]|uniref:RNA-guided pseudouridylation complex pseudouridine synthase subunit Cbf5 n=1 Tax=Methanogenium sp. MK-MG TaxID=2599926 RepID=UPI00352AE7A5|nr:tRNA pseudouridine synthase B [Methanogenium sp. MK-MG]
MKIAITRLPEKAGSDQSLCQEFGHECLIVSPMRAQVYEDAVQAFVTAANEETYDCIFFTSALPARLIGPLLKTAARIIAIGPQTAEYLAEGGVTSETLPAHYSRDFVPYLGDWIAGKKIGIPRADVPNPVLMDAITGAGGIVREMPVYALEPTNVPLETGDAEAILFTSANSHTYATYQKEGLLPLAIGEITAERMRADGTEPVAVGNGTLMGTLAALNHYLEENGNTSAGLNIDLPRGGIIAVDKPRGPSSHEVAAWVRDMLGMPCGHGGTLDPDVSGVLLVMVGRAARLAPVILSHEKEYIALLRLHGDATEEQIRETAREFIGKNYQRPPLKSAVARALRIRTMYEIDVLGIDGRDVLLRVRCEAGTYIRSLCRHIGFAIGTGGQMVELRRTRSGGYDETMCCSLHALRDAVEQAKNGDTEELSSYIRTPESVLEGIPTVTIRDTAVDALCHGASLAGVGVTATDAFKKDAEVAVMTAQGELICIGTALAASDAIVPGATGIVIRPKMVIMQAGTYPKGWVTKPPVVRPRKQEKKTAPAPRTEKKGERVDKKSTAPEPRKSLRPGPKRRPDNSKEYLNTSKNGRRRGLAEKSSKDKGKSGGKQGQSKYGGSKSIQRKKGNR